MAQALLTDGCTPRIRACRIVYFEEAYSLNYASGINDAIKAYNRYNSELGHTAGLMIVGHARLAEDVAMTRYEDGMLSM